MGQEWAASTPFMYFTDHEPELGRLVSNGRREEFKTFRAFSDPEQRAKIPDPQDEATFARSVLDRSERERAPHARVLALYSALLGLRRSDQVLRRATRAQVTAEAHGDVLIVRRFVGEDARIFLGNFGKTSRPLSDFALPSSATVLIDTQAEVAPSVLEPAQALIVKVREGAGG
jgi:maltooligosyltrehalose trehalohydrolase